MINNELIRDEIKQRIKNNKCFKIVDEVKFINELEKINVDVVVQSFNSVFERCPEPAPYQFDKSFDLFYEVGQKFLNELVAKKIVEKTDYDVVNIGIIYGNEPLHKWNE